MIKIEVCANSLASAMAALQGGASRIELCDNLREGGTTPSHGLISATRKLPNLPLYVLIRPRAGDFLYNDVEFDLMKADVQNCIDLCCDGIVTGILQTDGRVDKARTIELVTMAKQAGLGVTFHRAFDMVRDYFEALDDIIETGCDRILTSGGRTSAMEGANIIARLVSRAAGRIIIMPGSGVNENNIADLVHFTGATEFHTSAQARIDSKMEYRNQNILLSDGGEEYTMMETDAGRVKKIIDLANAPFR